MDRSEYRKHPGRRHKHTAPGCLLSIQLAAIPAYGANANNYDFTAFDAQINDAISKGQKFSFGIMTICSSCEGGFKSDGFILQYPQYLHNQMQAEKVRDWGSAMSGLWIPNWNSNAYLTALENLNAAINNHINSSSFNGVAYKNVIGYIDIRHYGNWGNGIIPFS